MAQGHYNYSWDLRGTSFNAVKDLIRIDSNNGYLGDKNHINGATFEASINTLGLTDDVGSNYTDFPEIGWNYATDGSVIWLAAIQGAPFVFFDVPVVVGHVYTRSIKISSGSVRFDITDETTGNTQNAAHAISRTGYPDAMVQFEWWNPANLGPFKTALSCTIRGWEVSTNGGATYTLVSSRAGVKTSDPPWSGTFDVSGCNVEFGTPVPTPTPSPNPAPTPTPSPVPNQCNPAPTPSPNPAPGPGAANDQFGIQKIYQTKVSGEEWYVSSSGNDSRSNPASHTGSGGAAGFKVQSTQVRWGVFPTSGYNEGSCVLNQATLMSRGYMQSQNDWKNVEITAHFRYNSGTGSSNNGGEHIELMARGGEHHDGNGCLGTALHSNSYPNGRAKFEKELEHTAGYTTNDPQTTVGGNAWVRGQWFGLKAVFYNTGNNVKLEQYVDKNCTNNWMKVLDFTDSGQWGGGSPSCGGSANTKITWGGPIAFFRWDNINDMDIRYMSVREIQTTASAASAALFTTPQPVPTITGDTTPPSVTSFTPTNGATNVVRTSNLTVVMTDKVLPDSVNVETVKVIENATGNVIGCDITLGSDNKTITINPVDILPYNTVLKIQLIPGGILSLTENAISLDPIESTFTTVGPILRTPSDTVTKSESISRNIIPGGSIGSIVYDLAGTSHHTDVTTDGTDLLRVGMLIGSGSALIGVALTRIIVRLRTGATSPTGTFQVGIRKANDTFLQFGTTTDVTTLPDDNTDRDYTYDLITNHYVLAVGDRITIETTNIASGTLSVKKHSAGGIANITMQDYNGSTWSNESSGYQFAGTWYNQGS